MTPKGSWLDVHGIMENTQQYTMNLKEPIESITLSGDGEPTLYPYLPHLITRLRSFRDHQFPNVPLTILTNASSLSKPTVVQALRLCDRVIAKLDAGDSITFHAINQPAPNVPSLDEIVRNLMTFRNEVGRKLILQTLLMTSTKSGIITNTIDNALHALKNVFQQINPDTIQLYTISRTPAESYCAPVQTSFLETVAQQINPNIDGHVVIYPSIKNSR
jgi:wyosine [tRNA(Phe)-imidazoG37] synthetase (radical SAM superfamily)